MNVEGVTLSPGIVEVQTTQHRGFTPEEVADRCLTKLLSVSDTAPPAIRDQAIAYKEHMRAVLVFYMNEAVQSDRTTVNNALLDAGQKDLAEMIRRL
jgi:hypothetical protein|tara:strand:+ start:1924 stop:2214 length:291 start_codon:yes stop_codon:yes gene_type:complete